MKRNWIVAGALATCMLLGGSAFAKDHDRDHDKRRDHRVERRDIRWDRDHDRDRRDRDHDRRPAGWSKGKKTGWGDCDLPPGQAKKHGCYDRDEYRRRHEHRAIHREPARTRTSTGAWNQARSSTTTTTTTTTTRNNKPGAWGVAKDSAQAKQGR